MFGMRTSVFALISFSILPLACLDVWNQALAVVFICGLAAFCLVRFPGFQTAPDIRALVIPLLILGAYSFLQGILTLALTEGGYSLRYTLLPLSFDPMSSIWIGIKIGTLALFFVLLQLLFSQRLRPLCYGLLLIGFFFAMFGILRFLMGESFVGVFGMVTSPRLQAGVGFGTYFNQNHFGFLMEMAFGLGIALFRYPFQQRAWRFIALVGSLTTWAALVLTGSRGAILGSFVSIAVFVFVSAFVPASPREKTQRVWSIGAWARGSVLLLAILAALVVGVSFIGQDRVVERFEKIPQQISSVSDASTFKRMDVWKAAVDIFREYPVFGTGFGSYYVAVSQFIDISGQVVPFQAHNEYLELAASGGLVALILAIWPILRYFKAVRISLRKPSYSFATFARNGAVAAIAGVAIHSLFDFGLQLLPNQLFFISLVFISINAGAGEAQDTLYANGTTNLSPYKIAAGILIVAFAVSAGFFGYSRYRLAKSTAAVTGPTGAEWYAIPFDPEFLAGESEYFVSKGDFEIATERMQSAIAFRPNDYELWLKLAEIYGVAGQNVDAANAYTRAIELSPAYARPHFLLGSYLLKSGQAEDGLRELREASRRNRLYFPDVLAAVLKEHSGSIAETEAILGPLEPFERDLFAEYLVRQTNISALPASLCGDSALSDATRFSLIEFLFDKRRFDLADQLNRQNCSPGIRNVIDDPDFEGRSVSLGRGFGWRFSTSSDNTTAIVEGKPGQRFLRIKFNGDESEDEILSQLILAEKDKKYRLSFNARSSHVVSGGLPSIQAVSEDLEGIRVLSEVRIPSDTTDWQRFSLDLATGKETNAFLIRLTRSTCPQLPCPIFGELWLDNFSLEMVN
jgi:O-antigen ligase